MMQRLIVKFIKKTTTVFINNKLKETKNSHCPLNILSIFLSTLMEYYKEN